MNSMGVTSPMITYWWNGYGRASMHVYDSVSAAKHGLERYLTFYNQHGPRSILDRKTPDEFYDEHLPTLHHAA
jgi:putative transposase